MNQQIQLNRTMNTDKTTSRAKWLAARTVTVLLAGAAFTTHAQTWVNVYHPALGGIAGVCGDMGSDASGNVYAVGREIAPDGSSVAIVQGSSDHGATWSVLDQYSETGRSYAHHRAFAADHVNGNLFAGGNLNNILLNGTAEFDTLWLIREWNPQTRAWSTAEDYTALFNDVGQASCADIMVSPSGDVYATGGGKLGTGLGWLVRKRPAGASSFTTVDADYSGQSSGSGWDLAFHSSCGVFAVGDVNGIWTVRRSPNGEKGTWSTVDSFYTAREWTSGSAKCILATASTIHVVGSAYNASTRKTYWVVRSSSDGGLTWSITDMAVTGISVEARGIVEDTAGNLMVCGQVTGAAGGLDWIVRKGTPGTKLVKQGKQWVTVPTINWTTSDEFQLVSGKSAQPNAITADIDGNIYVSGSAQDASGTNYWIVRKLAVQ
jgi:beta-propeller repeat-containing protein